MVRLSDILKVSQAKGQPERPATPSVSSAVQPAPPREVLKPSGPVTDPQESQALYRELLAACQCCLDEAQREQRFALGNIPAVLDRLVDRLIHDALELLQLSTMGGGGFSLTSHGLNVAILAVLVGLELDLKKPQLLDLALACVFHDIGMVKISHLIHTPAHLGPEQLTQVREHPVLGQRLLQRCPEFPPFVRDIIAQEHERCDGSGYPNRLRGHTIHEHAQLIGLLDVYEALTHDRPYRKRLVPSDAMRTIVQDHRVAFRHELLRAFLKAVPMYPVESWVHLTTGELAKVVAVHRSRPLAPIVTILIDPSGQPCAHPETIDLSKEQRRSIVRAVLEPSVSHVC